MLKVALALSAFAKLSEAIASGTMTANQLGVYAITAVNAVNAAIASIQALPSATLLPGGLILALQTAQKAAEALLGVGAGGTEVQQYEAAIGALLPIAEPFLLALGPAGDEAVIALNAASVLVPVLLANVKLPQPSAPVTIATPTPTAPMTMSHAVLLYGPKT